MDTRNTKAVLLIYQIGLKCMDVRGPRIVLEVAEGLSINGPYNAAISLSKKLQSNEVLEIIQHVTPELRIDCVFDNLVTAGSVGIEDPVLHYSFRKPDGSLVGVSFKAALLTVL